MSDRLDTPSSHRLRRRPSDPDRVGRVSEAVARFFGTPRFLVWLTVFVAGWLAWNTLAPERLRFDSQEFGFTVLTLMLSLQASYSSPLILLAQNRQVDRDRVSAEQDRQRADRTLADTDYLTREIAALRLAISETATRDFVRSELRDLLQDEVARRDEKILDLERELATLREHRLDELAASAGTESHRDEGPETSP
jgi:uncharacterized membrane protein